MKTRLFVALILILDEDKLRISQQLVDESYFDYYSQLIKMQAIIT